jgi:DNA-directed RNA polymerase subunit RPC12/RpoP
MIDRIVDKYLGEDLSAHKAWKAKESDVTEMKCMECGREFKKKISKGTYEVKCPKCGSYDTEPK